MIHDKSWGPWALNPEEHALVVPIPGSPGTDYHIDLYGCTSSAGVLNWIAQIAGKGWADQGSETFRDRLYANVLAAFAETDRDRLRAAVLQVAATASGWVEAIDRRDGAA